MENIKKEAKPNKIWIWLSLMGPVIYFLFWVTSLTSGSSNVVEFYFIGLCIVGFVGLISEKSKTGAAVSLLGNFFICLSWSSALRDSIINHPQFSSVSGNIIFYGSMILCILSLLSSAMVLLSMYKKNKNQKT